MEEKEKVARRLWGFPGGSEDKESACNAGDLNLPAMQETWVRTLGQKDPLEKGKGTHFSILAWEILWTEEPARLQFMELKRSGHK